MSNNKVTIYDVARKADVSLATVSRVSNNPSRVKEKTRNRVLEVIKELGYRPNAIARGLASRRSTNVALIVPTFSRASVSRMTNGVSDVADKYRYSVFLNVTHNEGELEADAWANMIASQVDGILMVNDQFTEEKLGRLKDETVPTVLLGSKAKDGSIPAVLIDYESAAYEATKKLIDNGNKKIAFVTVKKTFEVNELKEQGYQKALKEAGLKPQIIKSSDKVEEAYEEFKGFFAKEDAPDAALVIRDSIAVTFLNAALDHGISVPNDLEIVGFQNTPYAIMSRPQLSTVSIPLYDVGAVGMRLLTKLMNNEPVDNTEVLLPHSLVWRGTTK